MVLKRNSLTSNAFRLTLFILALSVWRSAFGFCAEPLYTLSATVTKTEPENKSFSAHFKHPATGEDLEYLFKVTENTGMNGLKNVRELQPHDLLQIDYFKTADGSLRVEYMARVKLDAAPSGLDQFHPTDLLKKSQ